MKIRICLMVCWSVSVAAAAQELPRELSHIEELAANEKAATAAMRDFHRLQEELLRWDAGLRANYLDQEAQELAKGKEDDIDRRLELIETGWLYLLGKYPESAPANNYYGEYLHDYTDRGNQALQYWHASVDSDDTFAPGHNNLGVYYLHSGAVRLGLGHLHKAVELRPDDPDFLFNMAQAYLNYFPDVGRWYEKSNKKIYAQAMEYSRRAAEIAPDDFELVQDYAVNFYAAENFEVKPDWSLALGAWDDVLNIAPNDRQRYFALLNKGRVLIRMERWSDAIAELERALRLNPNGEAPRKLITEANDRLAGKKN